MRTVLAALATAAALLSPVNTLHAAPEPHFGDAPVRAIQFFDANEGWAVGDEGAVWHTIDGGDSWERQPSGTRASLRGVHFLNAYTGWAVGRTELPGGGSAGVVLATSDGGLKWEPVSLHSLPGLNCVKFFNERSGIVAGDGSDAFPTGVFVTLDGGKSWKPLPGPRCPSWLAADFADADTGALAGAWSRLATLRNGLFGAADVDTLGGRSVCGLKITGRRAVAVGLGGLVLTSATTAGVRWGFPDLKLPPEALAVCDFHAVATHGKHVWVVGRPGSVVLHSTDFGQTWEAQRTGQPLPLHAVQFLSETEGWAAGELGTILRTRDGGKTWKVQRQGGQRAAVLFVHADGKAVPLDALALLGGEDGYLTAALRVTAADPGSAAPARALDPDRLAAAVRRSGGAAAESLWQFPLPQFLESTPRAQLFAGWDRLHGGRAAEQMLRQLVLALRVWQPEVVVVDRLPGNPDAAPAEAVLAEAVKEAFKLAGDPKIFPEQIETLGLSAWGAKKLYALGEKPETAAVRMDLSAPRLHLGDCPRDFVSPSAKLLGDGLAFPAQRGFRLIATRLKDAPSHADLMEGIVLAPGGTARRKLPAADANALAGLEKVVRQRQTLEALARPNGTGLTNPDEALAQIGPALKGLPPDQGALAAYRIADGFARGGQWVLAREAFLLMVDRYPAHPLSAEAYRWLARYHSSSEAKRRQDLGQFMITARTEVRQASAADAKHLPGPPEIVQARQLTFLGDRVEARKWYQGALELEPRLAALGAIHARDPAVQLCMQSARRQLGEVDSAKKWLSSYLAATAVPAEGPQLRRGADPWRECAAAELWLTNRTGPAPTKPLGYCKQTPARPHLDGKLDDPCWESAKPLVLRNAFADPDDESRPSGGPDRLEKEFPTKAWFCYDNGFLYVAVRCEHPEGKAVPAAEKRTRDADLRAFDRVSVLLDLDRDYQTYFRFQVDQRGCLAEDCWGDRTWNPRWFVAVKSEPTCWTAEIAIPLLEITGDPVPPGKVWAANVVRVLPGRGVQAWSGPADVRPRPEGMGLLQFTQEPKRKD